MDNNGLAAEGAVVATLPHGTVGLSMKGPMCVGLSFTTTRRLFAESVGELHTVMCSFLGKPIGRHHSGFGLQH